MTMATTTRRSAEGAPTVSTVSRDERLRASLAVGNAHRVPAEQQHRRPVSGLQLAERARFDLPDALPGDSHQPADLLQRHPLRMASDGFYRLGVLRPLEVSPRIEIVLEDRLRGETRDGSEHERAHSHRLPMLARVVRVAGIDSRSHVVAPICDVPSICRVENPLNGILDESAERTTHLPGGGHVREQEVFRCP